MDSDLAVVGGSSEMRTDDFTDVPIIKKPYTKEDFIQGFSKIKGD